MKVPRVTSKGQVTIPKSVRDALNLKKHDQVVFVVDGDRAFLTPVRSGRLLDLYGIAARRAPFRGRDAEREAVRRYVAERVVKADVEE